MLRRLICSPLFLTGIFLSFVTLVSASPRRYVENGLVINARTEQGSWTQQGQYLVAGGSNAELSFGDIITTGNFRIEITLNGNHFGSNPGFVVINGLGELGFVRPTDGGPMYTRGFFFGDMTRSVGHRRDFFNDGDDFLVSIDRTDDTVVVAVNEKPVWTTIYEGNRVFGKIGVRSFSGRLQVKSARLVHGNTAAFSTWVNPRTQQHPLPGEQVDVFARGDGGGYHTYRIPAVSMTRTGVLLAFVEGRKNSASDAGEIHLLLKRSLDGGKSWEDRRIIYSEPGDVTIGNPVPVHDRRTNTTWLAFCRNNNRVFITRSNDDGLTWAAPQDITGSVKKPEWDWYATGPGHGLITSSGRIVIPANHGSKSHVFFSDDNGQTWQLGEDKPGFGNEVLVAETSDGSRLLMNARNRNLEFKRLGSYSSDGGATWGPSFEIPELVEPTCQGSILSFKTESNQHYMLFSNPASERRERMTIRFSSDNGRNWSSGFRLYEGSASYSDLVYLGDGMVGCLYERDWYDRVTFARIPLGLLVNASVDNWMEQEVAIHEN